MGDFDHRCGLPVARVAAPAAALGTGLRRYDGSEGCGVPESLRRQCTVIAAQVGIDRPWVFVFPSNAMRSSRSAQSRVPEHELPVHTPRAAPLPSLFLTQFAGAFNDNFYKNALVVLMTFQAAQFTTLAPGCW